MRPRTQPAAGAILLILLAVNTGRAGPVALSPRVITLPPNASAPRFVDVDGDGRCDLLVLDPVQKRLFTYHQLPAGFSSAPDQAIPLPPQTAWIAIGDVDAHAGLELVMSTANGLVYSWQNAGRFEAEWRTLIEANQVFTNTDLPILIAPATKPSGTNASIPVIFARQAVLYQRNAAYEWSPGPTLSLDVERTACYVNRGDYEWLRDYPGSFTEDRKRRYVNRDDYEWTLGRSPAHSLRVQQSFRARPEPERDREPENKAIRTILEEMEKNTEASSPGTEHADIDGDGREDLVLWQYLGKLDFRTDVHVFLRGAAGQLPGRPTQVLHCRGLPVPFGPDKELSPVRDLNGDGIYELVLLELKTTVTSPSEFLDVLLSGGAEWALTIRSFQRGAFSRSPDASVPVTMLVAVEELGEWPVWIHGDCNGDGRPDLLVRRSDTQWNIYSSTTDGSWFAPHPALTFDSPARGYLGLEDLNGDGLADLIWREPEASRLSIFMSPSRPARSKNP